MVWPLRIAVLLVVLVMVAGWRPLFSDYTADGLLSDGYSPLETGVRRLPNGVYLVRALTRMPGARADMVHWWFADYLQSTEHYQRWHPGAHLWMDWENKIPGEIVGASHLVHETIGEDLQKLRIQFIEPTDILPDYAPRPGLFVICARVGELERPINMASMCHVVRDTEWGAEMRSTFWLGHVARRDGNDTVFSVEGLVGNTALARWLLLNERIASDLMIHAVEEMGYLSEFLPALYGERVAGTIVQALNPAPDSNELSP